MSTPRTDAVIEKWMQAPTPVPPEFIALARDLERENARLRAEVEVWKESAAQFSRNADFYRDIVRQIGLMFGDDAKRSDDGSMQDDVLALKVPELVEALRVDAERYRWLRSDSRVGRWMVMQWLPHLGRYERVSEEKINEYIDSERKK